MQKIIGAGKSLYRLSPPDLRAVISLSEFMRKKVRKIASIVAIGVSTSRKKGHKYRNNFPISSAPRLCPMKRSLNCKSLPIKISPIKPDKLNEKMEKSSLKI